MKRVVSVSLGSDKGDHHYHTDFLGEKFCISRVGTNSCLEKVIETLKYLDSFDKKGNTELARPEGVNLKWLDEEEKCRITAFGIGGTDLYFGPGMKLREGKKIANSVKNAPIVDGYGLKITLEPMIIENLKTEGFFERKKNVLITSGADRIGMARAFRAAQKEGVIEDVVYGDLMYLLKIYMPIRSYSMLQFLTYTIGSVVSQLPTRLIYPTGAKQKESKPAFESYQDHADIIAGDFHQMWAHLTHYLSSKMIITNTTTDEQVKELRKRGLEILVTTTPPLGGRSFGTNVWEAVLVANGAELLNTGQYRKMIKDASIDKPNIRYLQKEKPLLAINR